MRRLIATLALLAFAATLLFALYGCSHRLTGVRNGNQTPHTILFVQGPVDTVNHLVHLYWYGTDADGYVRGFEIKLVNPEDTVAADSAWHFTTRTDTLVAIYTPQGHAAPTFYARAIDNAGGVDPSAAVQRFNFSNKPPFVTWKVVPQRIGADRSDTSYAAVTVSWTISDPDGELARAKYRVWLDGRETTPDIVTGLQYTVPSDRFLVNGAWTTGPRTLNLQAIDDGGMAGNTISTTWYVRAPVPNPNTTPGKRPGRLLIIDDLPASAPSGFMDTLYTNTARRNLPDGTWSTLSLETSQPFRTWQDLAQTMSLFDAVVWYRGAQDSVATVIRNFEPALGAYLGSGGRLYLDGLLLVQGVNASGALSPDFAIDYLDCEALGPLRNYYRTASFDSTAGWGNINGAFFVSNMFSDTLRQQQLPAPPGANAGGLRVFNVKRTSDIAIMAAPGAITPARPDSLPVGVSVQQPSGGRAVVISFPIGLRGSGNAPRFLAKVFTQLGLVGP